MQLLFSVKVLHFSKKKKGTKGEVSVSNLFLWRLSLRPYSKKIQLWNQHMFLKYIIPTRLPQSPAKVFIKTRNWVFWREQFKQST